MAYKLPNTRMGIPLDIDGQYELVGQLMSARALIRAFRGGDFLLEKAKNEMLQARVESLEKCRDDLTKLVQELNAEVTRLSRKRK